MEKLTVQEARGVTAGRGKLLTAALRAAACAFSVLLAVVLLELTFRYFRWHQLYPPEHRYHPIYHHRMKPNWTYVNEAPDYRNVIQTNDLGLRGSKNYGKKKPGVKRLLMVGDSFTLGKGVEYEETFCAFLQGTFDERGRPIEVINAGTDSYSPLLHYLTLRDLYLDLQPDAVMLWFTFADVENDLAYSRHIRYAPDGSIEACDRNYTRGRFDLEEYLKERTALGRYLHGKLAHTVRKIRLLGFRRYLAMRLRSEPTKALTKQLAEKEYVSGMRLEDDAFMMIRPGEHAQEVIEHWKRSAGYLVMIRDLLSEHDIPFAIAIYPFGIQVGPDQWGKGRIEHGFEPGVVYDDPWPFELVEAFGADEGIPIINTYPSFLAERDKELFFEWDGHFTPEGHRVAASHLSSDLAFSHFLNSTPVPEPTGMTSAPPG